MNAPVEVEGLRFRYAGSEAWVLDRVDMAIQPGETVLLLGPSGCGKSTLALCLNGLIPHLIEGEMEGQVRIQGRSTTSQLIRQLCQQVGEVFQDPETQLVMPRVSEEVAFGLENLAVPRPAMEARIEAALSQVGLLERRNDWVGSLSGGHKQRLALAAVLALHPSILVLDEPTANLDPLATATFFRTLRGLKTSLGIATLLIEHRLDAALPLVDRVIALSRQGRVMAAGTPQTVFNTRPQALEREGIWLPTTCQLAMALQTHGWPVAEYPVSLDGAETMLRRLLPPIAPSIRVPKPAPDGPSLSETGDSAVVVDGLHYSYPGGPPVLQDVHLHVAPGRFFALVGANGSGKTTLARHLVGLLRPARGQVTILGRPAHSQGLAQLARQVGYVFQNPEHQFVTQRVADELAYSLQGRWGHEEAGRRVDELLHTFGLAGSAQANPFALSQGQKRRLSVATMVALGQPILILDEPTFGQDRHTAAALMATLKSLHAAGTTILFITHDMQLVAEYAQEVAVMQRGRVIFQGTPRALFQQPELVQQANLALPPLAELGRRLGHPGLFTVADWLAWVEASPARSRVAEAFS